MHGVFDIIGPTMIGPSSSHTAGAARLGKMARIILGENPATAVIELHGSFAQTYRGHGTDKALVAGLLGYTTDDVRIKEALSIAPQSGLDITFRIIDLGDSAHPNTAVFHLTGVHGRQVKVVGASTGGGSIIITEIDGYTVELTGEYHTLISIHQDKPGVIALITHMLAQDSVNIAFMRVSRREKGSQALAIIEADHALPEHILTAVSSIPSVKLALLIPPL
ncbi:L-serine dehydratase, beta chain [bioreactor metagenome]|uniref:L-serine dehydratase, beta chain n=1 Tax=bioreactor metagenome TaxID=1076179 RepID=A0A644TNT7_9ZZZZ|nr:L-serine ammonia-lyase, iron-sulfur-dependent subunit beta [Negativicutes bacterium]